MRYLGHIVSVRGVETDPEKIAIIKSWPTPTNLKQLRLFLGFAGYYYRFIKNYAGIPKPLNDLTLQFGGLRPRHPTSYTAAQTSLLASDGIKVANKPLRLSLSSFLLYQFFGLLVLPFLTSYTQMQAQLGWVLHCIKNRMGSCG